MPQRIVSPPFSATKGIPFLFSRNWEVFYRFRCLPLAAIEELISKVGIPASKHDDSDLTGLIYRHHCT